MRTFHAFGREFEYWQELGERTVELPIAQEIYLNWLRCGVMPSKIIEVGYVLARHNGTAHRVIDLFEKEAKCETIENIDAGSVDFTNAFVISISTLEHFDMPDYGNTETGGHRGVDCLRKILKTSSGYFITWPIGYSDQFDSQVRQLNLGANIDVAILHQYRGPSNEEPDVLPEWEQVVGRDPSWRYDYGDPFHYGNAVGIISNVPWILNSHLA